MIKHHKQERVHPAVKNKEALARLVLMVAGVGMTACIFATAQSPSASTPWLVPLAIFGLLMCMVALWPARKPPDDSMVEDNRQSLQSNGIPREAFGGAAPMPRWVALGLAMALAGYVLQQIPGLILPDSSYSEVVWAWGLSFMFYAWAMIGRKLWRWPVADLRLWCWLVAIVLLAFVVRLWRLEAIPFTLGGDEASQGLEAIKVIQGDMRNPFSTGWLGVPTMSFFLNSVTIEVWGRTIFGLRLPWVLIGTLAVLVTFFLVRRLNGKQVALATAILLATYHYHIHFSRLGSNQIADPLLMALALWLLVRALQREDRLDWALLGGVTGLALYFYAGARLTPVVIAAVVAYHFMRQPRPFWQKHRLGLLVALGAFLLVAGPMIQYALRFPDDFNARLNMVGVFQSGWLEREVVIRGQSALMIMLDQFQRATLAFNLYPDRTVWYGLDRPLLDPLFGAMFLIGLLFATLRLWGRGADERLAPMVIWWWCGAILGGMLTDTAPSSQRLISLAVPVCFFIGLSLWELLQISRRAFVQVPVNGLLASGVGLFGVISLWTYFGEHAPRRLYGGHHAELATEIAPLLNNLAPTHRIYFLGAPFMYWGFATLPYLVPGADATDIESMLEGPPTPALVTPEKGAVFVILPERLAELESVILVFPDGTKRSIYSPERQRLLGTVYVAPAQKR